MKKLTAILLAVLALCLFAAGAMASGAPTQPPTPPPSTPRPAWTPDPNPTGPGYPFPTEVEGYTFVSFAGDEAVPFELDEFSLSAAVVRRYFEEVYPGCRLSRLEDFVVTTAYADRWTFAEAAGMEMPYNFSCIRFEHPLAAYETRFDVLVSFAYHCAFFTDAPDLAEYLEALETVPVTYEDALRIARETYLEQFAENGLPAPEPEELSSLLISVQLAIDHNSDGSPLRIWTIDYFEPQTRYDCTMDIMNILFSLELNADTSQVYDIDWQPQSERTRLLEMLDP